MSPIEILPEWNAASQHAVRAEHFGHNAVWVRGGLGIWSEEARTPDPDVLALVAALRPGILRFPGGTRAMRYHFADAIGPHERRKPQCDPFLGRLDPTGYGLDEHLRIAESIAASVTLVSPWVEGSPEEAAALVAYANASPSSRVALGIDDEGRDWGVAGDWAARRTKNGHAAPYGVRYLEIGNEQYLDVAVGPESSCGRPSQFRQSERWVAGRRIPTTARDHARQVSRTGSLVRAVDPSIRIGASAYSEFDAASDAAHEIAAVDRDAKTGDAWNGCLIEDARDAFDFFVLHPYDFTPTDQRLHLAERARKAARELSALAPDKRVAVSEYGFFFGGDTLMNAIASCDVVRMACEEGLEMALRHILIEDDPSGLFANAAAIAGPAHALAPAYHAMRLLRETVRGAAVPVTTSAPDVVALASRDAGERGLAIIDRRTAAVATDAPLDLVLPAGRWRARVTLLSGPSLTARASDIVMTEQTVHAQGTLRIDHPPHALVFARLEPAR